MEKEEILELIQLQEELQSEIDQLKGQEKSLLGRLKEVHEVSSLTKAKEKLRRLQKKVDRMKKSFGKQLDEFKEEWSDVLDV